MACKTIRFLIIEGLMGMNDLILYQVQRYYFIFNLFLESSL